MKVYRVEATNENMSTQFQHVTVLPMYDIVVPEPNSDSAYGAHTKLVSIRNDERQKLAAYVRLP